MYYVRRSFVVCVFCTYNTLLVLYRLKERNIHNYQMHKSHKYASSLCRLTWAVLASAGQTSVGDSTVQIVFTGTSHIDTTFSAGSWRERLIIMPGCCQGENDP